MCRTREKFAQAVNQFFQGESGGSRSRRKFSRHLAELTLALDRLLFRLSFADECSCALLGFKQASKLEFPVGAHYRIGIDGEIDGKLADCRKLISRRQGARGDTRPHLIDELAINRDASMKIKAEGEAAVLEVSSHAH